MAVRAIAVWLSQTFVIVPRAPLVVIRRILHRPTLHMVVVVGSVLTVTVRAVLHRHLRARLAVVEEVHAATVVVDHEAVAVEPAADTDNIVNILLIIKILLL